jgi:hypothetical protein
LERKGCGWWIHSGLDPLAACLNEVLSTPRAVLDQRGQIGKDWVSRELSWPRIAEQMLLSYRWLLTKANRPDWILV